MECTDEENAGIPTETWKQFLYLPVLSYLKLCYVG